MVYEVEVDGRKISKEELFGDVSQTTVKRVSRNEHILKELDYGRYMSTDILIDRIIELDKAIPGRYEGYVLTKDNDEMFYSDIFVEDLLKKKFDKHIEETEQLLSPLLKDGDISGS